MKSTEKKRRDKILADFERSEIARIKHGARSAFIEIYKITDGDKVSYIASTSEKMAKIDYAMMEIYRKTPKSKRSKKGVMCNPLPDVSGLESKYVYAY